jgi:hypothetical protein
MGFDFYGDDIITFFFGQAKIKEKFSITRDIYVTLPEDHNTMK